MARPTLFGQLARYGVVALAIAGSAGVLLATCSGQTLVEADRTRGRAEMARVASAGLAISDLLLTSVERRRPEFYRKEPTLHAVEREHGLEALDTLLHRSDGGEAALQALAAYRAAGDDVAGVLELTGFEDHGVEGELRAAAHRLEDRLAGDPEAMVALLQLRRVEKDFMLRNDQPSVDLHRETARALRPRLAPAALIDLDLYLARFDAYVRLSRLLGFTPEEGLLRRQTDARNALQAKLRDWGRAQGAQVTALFDRARWLWGVSLVLGLSVMLVAGWAVARSIRRELAEVGAAARAIGQGELGRRAPPARTEEVAVVAEAVNAMAVDLARAERLMQARRVQLERANAELRAFSSSVSHDLRAPLRSMAGFAGALMADFGDRLPPEARDYCERIRAAASRMSGLVDALLRLAQVNRAALRWEPIDLSRLAHQAAGPLLRATEGRRIELVVEPGMQVHGDAGLLEAALANLLANAIKFSRDTEAAKIEVARDPARPAGFLVRDNGAGFDPAYRDKLFQVFQRLHGRDYEGTGVGLATVKRIIERHGGQVWAESAPGAGATFGFTLSPTLPDEELAREPDAARMV